MDSASAAVGPQIDISWQGEGRIVTVGGAVDAANAHHLHAALARALYPDSWLIADLTQLTALGEAGVRALLLNQRNADLQGAHLLIVPSPVVATALARSGDQGLTACPDLADALIAARRGSARRFGVVRSREIRGGRWVPGGRSREPVGHGVEQGHRHPRVQRALQHGGQRLLVYPLDLGLGDLLHGASNDGQGGQVTAAAPRTAGRGGHPNSLPGRPRPRIIIAALRQ